MHHIILTVLKSDQRSCQQREKRVSKETRQLRSLITSLTFEDTEKLMQIMQVPTGIKERTDSRTSQFIFELRDEWEDFNGAKFSKALEDIGRRDLIARTKNIPWLIYEKNKSSSELNVGSFIKLLRDEMKLEDWKFILWSEFNTRIGPDFNQDKAFYHIIEKEAIEPNLVYICELMELVGRKDLQKIILLHYKPVFNTMNQKEIKKKLKKEYKLIYRTSNCKKIKSNYLLKKIIRLLNID